MEIYIPISLLWLPWIITIGSLVYFSVNRSAGQYGGGAVADLLYWLIIVVITWSVYHLIKLIVWAFS